jgi:tetratricopeptide (TPR) repeat protein
MRILSLLLLLALSYTTLAQGGDEELAAQYFSNGDYDKAAEIYDRLLSKNPSSTYHYDNLLKCYINLKHYEQAEKLVKKQSKRYPRNFIFRVDQGYLIELQEKKEKANELYSDLIKDLKKSNREDVPQLASAFIRRGLHNYAINTFLQGRKLSGNDAEYAYELAEQYGKVGNTEKMIEEFLTVMIADEAQIESVQNNLQMLISDPKDYETLKKVLGQRLQKEPDHYGYAELLLWLLMQQKDFKAAYVHSAAMDKRLKEGGRRLIRLAEVCLSNDNFAVAAQCYQYVINLGESGNYYLGARLGLLDTKFKKLQYSGVVDPNEVNLLIKDYSDFLDKYGKKYSTAQSMRQLAEIYLRYAHQPEKAISTYQEIIELPQIPGRLIAQCKLELGDAYLVSGDVWEPALLYGQVNKDFNEDPLGQEAKMRNARLAYYKGEFEWAQTQLDILKSATSQTISNDAIELSLIIQDNTGLDSSEDAMKMYAAADLLLYQNRLQECFRKLDSIPLLFPGHSLTDEIYYVRAKALRRQGNFAEAKTYYEKILSDFSFDILADNALFELADMTENQLNNKEAARDLYEKLILKYSSSLFVVEARKRYRSLRGDNVN